MHDPHPKTFGLAIENVGDHELLNGRFRDFDELSAAVSDWDFDFVQLDAGPSPSVLTQIATPSLLIHRFSFGRTYIQRGASSPTMRTFGFPVPGTPDIRMFGDNLSDSDLARFRTGGEFEAVSPAGFGCVTISIDEARLDECFAAIDAPRLSGHPADESGIMRLDPKIVLRMRCHATQILDELEATSDALAQSELLEDLTFQLPIDLALAITSANVAPRLPDSRVRDLALRRAVSFIEDRLDDPPTVRGLCEEVGVGWTTLAHVFREHFGVTPKAYLRAVRLNGVRKDLRAAAPEVLVADAANRWGFWHMGQFAADYKRLFGELPSQTKARVLSRLPTDRRRLESAGA